MPDPSLNQNAHVEPAKFHLPGYLVVHRRIRGDCPSTWKASVRLVALTLAGHLDKDDRCFVLIDTLAHECGLRRRAVQYALNVLTAGDAPLFVKGPRTNRSSTFRLVRNPVAFVEAREQARGERRRKQFFADMRQQLGGRRMDAGGKVQRFPAPRKEAVRCPECHDHAVLWPDGFLQDYYTWEDNETGDRTPHKCRPKAPLPDDK